MSPGVTTLVQGTGQLTNGYMKVRSYILVVRGTHLSGKVLVQWLIMAYNLKSLQKLGDRVTTTNPPGLQVWKSRNEQNIGLHVKPTPRLAIPQQAEDRSMADKSSPLTVPAAQAFIQQNIQKCA